MTTQELNNKIERVLGNNVRCLLPSYWWKNLLHSVADRIDTVEQKIGDDSGIAVVDSKEALYDLDLPKGSVASVTNEGIKPSECYQPTDEEMDNEIEVLSKLTPVRNVELITDKVIPGGEATAVLVTAALDAYMLLGISVDNTFLFVAVSFIDGEATYIYDIDKANEVLASRDFRFLYLDGGTMEALDGALRFNTSTDVYAKSASWDKLMKEGEVQEAEGLVFVLGFDEKGNILLTDEEKEANKRSYRSYSLNPELKCILKYYLTSDDGSIDHVFPGVPQADLVGAGFLTGAPLLPGVVFYGVSFGNAPALTFELFGKYDVCFMQDGTAYTIPHFNMGEIALLYMGGDENTLEWQRQSNKNMYDWWSSNYAPPIPVMVVIWVNGGTVIYPAQMMKIKDTGGTHIRFYFWDALTLEVCELNADGTVSKFEQYELFGREMSDTSVFGVQNSVVKKYIDDKVKNIDFPPVDAELSDTSTNAVQNKAVKKYMDDEVKVAVNALYQYLNDIDAYLKTEVSKKVEQKDVDSSIEQATDNIKKIIEESEDVAASAIAQLNAAVEDIINRLNNAGI